MATYRKMEIHDEPKVRSMIKEFYKANPELKPIQDEHIDRTFSEFVKFPEKGQILVIEDNGEIIGYSIVVNMWSNEYGGNVLDIDELFVVRDRRGQGVGTAFIRWLIENHFNQCVSIELGTTPGNVRARALYEKLGFKPSDSHRFSYDF